MIDNGDLGIVLYLRGSASTDAPTYYDRKGVLRAAGTLGAGYTAMSTAIDTAHPFVSAAAATSMFVVVQGLGEFETLTIRCRQAYRPEPNPGGTADPHYAGPPLVYFDTLWLLQEPGITTNPDKEFALTNGAWLIQTASDLLGDQLEFSAKSASTSGSVMIAAKVGS